MSAAVSDTELLARLVAFDTTSRRSNLPLADHLADYLDRPGVEVVRHPSPDGAKANLLVRVGPPVPPDDSGSRPGLVLSGHMDVVPADEDGWSSDPFTLTERDDRLVARGSADMKGFLALAANVAREVVPESLAAPLVLLFTYDEEVGTLGAKHLVESWGGVEPAVGTLPRAAVIGEPTSLRVVRLHKGHLKMAFHLTGKSAHSGYPHLGVNAVEAAGRAVVALARLRAELEGERPASAEHFPEVPFAALNVGTIRGGSAVNVVPDRCTVEVGARVLPGMDSAELAERIRRTVSAAVTGDGAAGDGVPVRSEVLSDSPPLSTTESAPIHRHLCAAEEQEAGESVSFATDAGWLQRLGLECVIYGPGSIEVAHRPDEFVPRADLVAARRRLDELVETFCTRGDAA